MHTATPQDTKAIKAKKAALKGTNGTKSSKVRTSVTFHRPKTLTLARYVEAIRIQIPHSLCACAVEEIIGSGQRWNGLAVSICEAPNDGTSETSRKQCKR